MPRTLITAAAVLALGAGLTWWWVRVRPQPGVPTTQPDYPAFQTPDGVVKLPANAASDPCIPCHQRQSPAIVVQWSRSRHAARGVTCMQCHAVPAGHPMALLHEGTLITKVVTPKMCAGGGSGDLSCHATEAKQFAASRHSLPAWAAMSATDDFKHNPVLLAQYEAIEEIPRKPTGEPLPKRNALYDVEGRRVTPAACERCHSVGQPHPDSSAGRCSACHGRHEFSLAQVRKPETCNNCHIGPDHPQFEIYMESKHGIQYATRGQWWNWNELPGRLDTIDFPAATCAICHISGFGPEPTSHDVGDRLSWFLYDTVSTKRPKADYNRQRMQNVCLQCHNRQFILAEYSKDDELLGRTNELVLEGAAIMGDLIDRKLVGRDPNDNRTQFDERIEFTAFDLWHHWGRTAKFGAFMQGADYTQWHGIYPLLADLQELKERAAELKAGRRQPATQSEPAGPPARTQPEGGRP